MLYGERNTTGSDSGRASGQGRSQLRFQLLEFLQLAFPNHHDLPTQAAQIATVALVALHVRRELGLPKFDTRFRRGRALAARMPVPEAAVDEHDRGVTGQHDVG